MTDMAKCRFGDYGYFVSVKIYGVHKLSDFALLLIRTISVRLFEDCAFGDLPQELPNRFCFASSFWRLFF